MHEAKEGRPKTPYDRQHGRVADIAADRSDVRLLAEESDEELARWMMAMLRLEVVRASIRLPPGAAAAAAALEEVCRESKVAGEPSVRRAAP